MLGVVAAAVQAADAFFLASNPIMPLLRVGHHRHMPHALYPLHDDYDDGFASLLSPRNMLKTIQDLEHETDRILSGILESSLVADAAASSSARTSQGNHTAATDGRPFPELRLRPRFDVEDRADVFLLTAATPGLRKQDLSVAVVDGTDGSAYLIIAGHSSLPPATGGLCEESGPSSPGPAAEMAPSASAACLKASHSKFEHRIKLPSEAERDHIKASYENGLLSVTIPKRPKRQALKLRVPIA